MEGQGNEAVKADAEVTTYGVPNEQCTLANIYTALFSLQRKSEAQEKKADMRK